MASATRSGRSHRSSPHRSGGHQNRRACAQACQDGLASNGMTTAEPAQFREAVAAMNATTVRPEIELGPIRPPQRLAPFSYALGAEVRHPETAIVPERSEGDAFGRLILSARPRGRRGVGRHDAAGRLHPGRPRLHRGRRPAAAGSGVELARRGAGVAAPNTSPRWAARSPPPRRCATATSPGRRAPTSWSCGRRGRRRRWNLARTCRRSARCSSTRRVYLRPGSPIWAPAPAPDDGRTPRRPGRDGEPEATPLLAPRDGVPQLSVSRS